MTVTTDETVTLTCNS